MPSYTIRVELHDATWSDYTNLAARLAQHGISDVVTSDAGHRYEMPPAEYNYDGALQLRDVYAKVDAVAKASGRRYHLLVTESAGRLWNLALA